MATNALSKSREYFPTSFDDFFKPWNEWFESGLQRTMTVPAVNVTDKQDHYEVTLAAPGLNKEDFKVDVDNHLMTISAAKEENKEDKDKTYTRREYNYSSFSRSFSLPDEVVKEQITAQYTNGILSLNLPKKQSSKQNNNTIRVD